MHFAAESALLSAAVLLTGSLVLPFSEAPAAASKPCS